MKHTTEELLLAASVRELVAGNLVASTPKGLTDAAETQWRNEHVEEYTKRTMKELSMFADVIKDLSKA